MLSAPDTVDLRDALWPVGDVGQIPASAASAAATALEYHCNRIGEPPTNLSTAFIHYNARLAAGQQDANTGTTLEAALKAMAAHGACKEDSWPLDAARITTRPSAQAYDEAKKFAKILCINPADVIEALALRYPVPFTASVPARCLDEAGRTGIMPAPTTEELRSGAAIVNHAMVLVGYDKTMKTVTARNCWGTQWGRDGHCAISFDIMNIIAPYGSSRVWIVATPEPAETGSHVSAPEFARGGTPPHSGRLSDLTSKMLEEIRADLRRDLDEASKRIRDMVKKPGQQ
jgi:hypothetical protein